MKFFFYIVLVLLFVSCVNSSKIKTGDIVFRGATQSDLSEAINEVTQTSKSTNYTHMGICEVVEGKVIVYHSDVGKGVVKEPLELFMSSEDTISYLIDLYRIKNIDPKQIENAISIAETLISKPYNTTYILEDKGYYCSEYIYELFKKDSIFKLEPMTFKNPETQMFNEGWVAHYQNLGLAIPEGQLGCNPNGMANSEAITFIANLK